MRMRAETNHHNRNHMKSIIDPGAPAETKRAITAMGHKAGEKAGDAHKKLVEVVEKGRGLYGQMRKKAIARAKATHEAVQEHPYQAMGIALAAGALIGLILARRRGRSQD